MLACRLDGNSTNIRLLVDEISPPLEHPGSMFQVHSRVVGSAHLILIGVGQLCLDPIGFELTSFI